MKIGKYDYFSFMRLLQEYNARKNYNDIISNEFQILFFCTCVIWLICVMKQIGIFLRVSDVAGRKNKSLYIEICFWQYG